MRKSNKMKSLEGKVVIITGAAQGIGRGIAIRMAQAGADLALFDLKYEGLKDVKQEIENFGVNCFIKGVDVSDEVNIKEAIKEAASEFGRIDILINNAGYLERALVEDSTKLHWDNMLGVNLLGAVYGSQAAIPYLQKNSTGGSIINCSSILATFPNTRSAAYGIAKYGINILTRVLAAELAPYNIRVNAYSPGVANTEFAADVIANRANEKLDQIALHRFGEPEDIANLILFLVSDQASYITGQTIAIDGGMWTTQTPGKRWKEVNIQ